MGKCVVCFRYRFSSCCVKAVQLHSNPQHGGSKSTHIDAESMHQSQFALVASLGRRKFQGSLAMPSTHYRNTSCIQYRHFRSSNETRGYLGNGGFLSSNECSSPRNIWGRWLGFGVDGIFGTIRARCMWSCWWTSNRIESRVVTSAIKHSAKDWAMGRCDDSRQTPRHNAWSWLGCIQSYEKN